MFGRDVSPQSYGLILASTAPWRSRHFLFWRSRSGTLSYFGEIDYSLEMPEISRFDCPNCRAEYKLVRAEADPPPRSPDRVPPMRCPAPRTRGQVHPQILPRGSSEDPSSRAGEAASAGQGQALAPSLPSHTHTEEPLGAKDPSITWGLLLPGWAAVPISASYFSDG